MVDNSSHQAKNHGLWKTTGVYNFFVGGGDLFFFFPQIIQFGFISMESRSLLRKREILCPRVLAPAWR